MSQDTRDTQDGLVSLLAGIGVGVLIGSALALLMAPQTGAETRAQIRESADDALGRLKESMDELRVKVEDIAVNAREAVAHRRGGPDALQGDVAGATDESAGSS